MDNKYHNENYSFRFVNLPPKETIKFREISNDWKPRIKKYKNLENFVITFQIAPNTSYHSLINFIKENKIERALYGFFISLETNSDMDGVHVPDYILDLYKKVGGNIDFSFIFINEEDE